jgi:hypothetical protein
MRKLISWASFHPLSIQSENFLANLWSVMQWLITSKPAALSRKYLPKTNAVPYAIFCHLFRPGKTPVSDVPFGSSGLEFAYLTFNICWPRVESCLQTESFTLKNKPCERYLTERGILANQPDDNS